MTISNPEIAEIIPFAQRLADCAAAVTTPYFRSHLSIVNKAGENNFDPVTIADREAEAAMRALIRETYPSHAVLGEEEGHSKMEGSDGTDMWVLDPIDGTRSFISGFPTWGTLIAFNRAGKPLVGIMDQPFTGERYLGHPGGAFLGERKLRVRPCDSLGDATLFATTPDMFATPGERRAFAALESAVKLRRFGGDCYAYCMLAMGFVDLVVEASMGPYDIQALIPIVEGAGGIVTDWQGKDAANGGQILAAGNAALHAQAMAVLNG
jgi:myo-inositol-1(or 4)-monophosphatase